jgi:hypothetical protein
MPYRRIARDEIMGQVTIGNAGTDVAEKPGDRIPIAVLGEMPAFERSAAFVILLCGETAPTSPGGSIY